MESIFEAINEWIKELLIGAISGNLSNMFGDVNEKVGTIAAQAGQTPQGWNAGVFNMIQNLSQSVILPIAGLVITYVLCYELISMVADRNSLHDIDTWIFFKFFFKAWVAVYLVGIYAVLVNEMVIATNLHSAIFSIAAYTVILCFSLFKTGNLAKSIFHAH